MSGRSRAEWKAQRAAQKEELESLKQDIEICVLMVSTPYHELSPEQRNLLKNNQIDNPIKTLRRLRRRRDEIIKEKFSEK